MMRQNLPPSWISGAATAAVSRRRNNPLDSRADLRRHGTGDGAVKPRGGLSGNGLVALYARLGESMVSLLPPLFVRHSTSPLGLHKAIVRSAFIVFIGQGRV